MNFFSSLFSALTATITFLIIKELLRQKTVISDRDGSAVVILDSSVEASLPSVCAFAASFLFVLSPTFWIHAEVTEVYSLNAFFVILLYWLSLRLCWGVSGERFFFLIAFLFGLGLGNHHTLLLLLPSLFILLWPWLRQYLFSEENDDIRYRLKLTLIKKSLVSLFFFTLGFSVNLFIPVRSYQNPLLNWGTPSNVSNFIDVFMRKGYETQVYSRSWETLFKQVKSFDPLCEFGGVGLLLLLAGLYYLWKINKRIMFSLLTGVTFFSLVIISLVGNFKGNPEILMPFYLPAFIFCSVFIGAGFFFFYTRLRIFISKEIARSILLLLIIVISVITYSKNRSFADKSNHFLAHDYGLNEINSFSENAIYLPKVDSNTFVLWYLQKVEKYREDIEIIPIYFLTQRWYIPQVLNHLEKGYSFNGYAPDKRTLAMVNSIFNNYYEKRDIYTNYMDEEYISGDINTLTNGITFKLSRKEEKLDQLPWDYYQFRNIETMSSTTSFEDEVILKNYASSYYNYGLQLYMSGKLMEAISAFESSLNIRPLNADTLNNLAMLYAEKNIMLKKAESMALKSIQLHGEDKKKVFNVTDTLGWIYFKMGRYEEALVCLENAKPYLSGNPYYQYHLGMTLYWLGRNNEAALELSRARGIDEIDIRKEILLYLEKARSGIKSYKNN